MYVFYSSVGDVNIVTRVPHYVGYTLSSPYKTNLGTNKKWTGPNRNTKLHWNNPFGIGNRCS